MTIRKTILVAAALVSASVISFTAMSETLNERQFKQKLRIAEGVESGELTARETARMLKGQAQLQRMENRAKADGVVTLKERARLQAKANKESAKIYHNKHDNQDRY